MSKLTGGGIKSNKAVRVGTIGGSVKLSKIDPGAVSRIGHQQFAEPKPLATAAKAPVRMGNDLAKNVGKGGPGSGRKIHASGSQGRH